MTIEKHVDESWKESAEQDKDKLDQIVKEDAAKKPAEPSKASEESGEKAPEQVEEQAEDQSEAESAQGPEVNFSNYVTSLGFQAMIFLGVIPNPVTNEADKNLAQAKFIIDTLSLLKDKTQGNLSEQEDNLLNQSCYELQMKYVDAINSEQNEQGNSEQ